MKSQNSAFARPLPANAAWRVVATTSGSSDACRVTPSTRTLLALATGAAFTVVSAGAYAIEAKFSGQVNRALMHVDDGTNSELHNVDNATSSTRFRFTGSGDLAPGMKAGIVFETELLSNASNAVTQTTKSSSAELAERIMSVYVQSGAGTLTLGQGSGAADGGTEVDLSGTDVVLGALSTNAIGGAFEYFSSAGVSTGETIGGTIGNQDFESRYDRLRYDSPALGPIKVALSTGVKDNVDVSEVALRFSTGLAGGKLAGAIGSSQQDTTPIEDKTTGGSVSWLLASGLNFTYSTSTRERGNRDANFSYFKIGYKFGQHALAVDTGKGEDQDTLGDEAKVVGIGYVYQPQKWAELYASYKVHSFDRAGVSADDVSFLVVGSRLKF